MHLSLLTPTLGKHGALATKQNQTRIMPYIQGAYSFNLILTKLRIIPHIRETKKTPCPNPSITLSCLQLFRQEMCSHSPSSTFFISIPAHEKWYHFTLQCKLYMSHPIVFSSRFGRPQGRRKSSPESSSDSITWIGKQSTLLPWWFLLESILVNLNTHLHWLANEGVTVWGLKFNCKYKLTITR